MKRQVKKLNLNGETVRRLGTAELQAAHGGSGGSDTNCLTACVVCQPSDSPQHCYTYTRSGGWSCDAGGCTLITF